MTVSAMAVEGTIGGGHLEYRVIEQARWLLGHAEGAWRVQDYPLGPLLGQCCGGRVRLLLERADRTPPGGTMLRFTPGEVLREDGEAPSFGARGERPAAGDCFAAPQDIPRRPVLLFGAGHVGAALARALDGLPFLLAWYDSRPDYAERPGVTLLPEGEIERCLTGASTDAAILIMTHDHGLDYRLTRAALALGARFVGLIGSQTKRARFISRLEAEGVSAARLTCPIGLAGIQGKEPAVIAAAVAAQLLLEHAP
jgi:xanthine dehydrogenase accessory factor